MSQQTIAIRLPELELGEAGRKVEDLKSQLLDDVPGTRVDIRKDDPTNQDFGATLVVVLGTPAVVAIAHGIATWMKKRGQTIELEIDGGRTIFRATGPIDDTAGKIVEALSRRRA
ncbi:MAG TPA: hypothetical protein VKB34_14455 [Povalibacter sp.]|nr:hypothetical protein [Povalibacter sp.]